MLYREKVKQILVEIKPELEQKYFVRKIALFGSMVRGEEDKGSDIDILVEFTRSISLFKFMDLEVTLEAKLGRKIDLVTKEALKPAIGKQIIQEAAYL